VLASLLENATGIHMLYVSVCVCVGVAAGERPPAGQQLSA